MKRWLGLACLAMLLTLLAAACAGEEEEAPAAAPTPSPAEDGEVSAQTLAEFAGQVVAALSQKDTDFLTERARLTEYECTEDDMMAGFLPCEKAGQVVRGFPVGYEASEGTLLAPEQVSAHLLEFLQGIRPEEQDAFGDGGLRLYAIGPEAGCGTALLTAITGAEDGAEPATRELRYLSFCLEDGVWRWHSLLVNTGVFVEDILLQLPSNGWDLR